MSGIDVKKPETREDLIKMLSEAAKKESNAKGKPTKPTFNSCPRVEGGWPYI